MVGYRVHGMCRVWMEGNQLEGRERIGDRGGEYVFVDFSGS